MLETKDTKMNKNVVFIGLVVYCCGSQIFICKNHLSNFIKMQILRIHSLENPRDSA